MNQDIVTAQVDDNIRTRDDAKPNLSLVVALRTISLSAAYGMWLLFRWIESKSNGSRLDTSLMLVTVVIGVLLLLLGTVAPGKAVIKTWKIIGKVIMYILLGILFLI